MTKTKSQKARAKAAKTKSEAPRPRREKKWEFNLVKTGNNSLSYGSGNRLRAREVPQDIAVVSRPRSSPGIMEVPLVQDEFVALIDGSASFSSQAFPIQPGLPAAFPFGSKIASLYERYVVRDLAFYFKPTVSGFAVGGQAGKVLLSVDYDALSAPPATIQEVESMDPHIDGMPYQSVELRLDPRRCTPPGGKFTRSAMVPGGDLKTYDAGTLFVSVAGNLTAANIGELRVRYTLSLMNPRLTATKLAPCNCIAVFVAPVDTPFPSGGTPAVGGFLPLAGYPNQLGITFDLVAKQFTVPAGTYRITIDSALYAPIGCTIGTFDCSLVVAAAPRKRFVWVADNTTMRVSQLPFSMDLIVVIPFGGAYVWLATATTLTNPAATVLSLTDIEWSFQLI